MIDYKIVDDFLDQEKFNDLVSKTIGSNAFPMYYNHFVSRKENNDGSYFTHTICRDGEVTSSIYDYIFSLMAEKIYFDKIYRIQFNLYPKTFFRKNHSFHVDYEFPHKACILYLNTNNGKTILKNKPFNTHVNSVSNRVLFFDASLEHRSTTCTDSEFRSNIIFNYA